METRNDLLLDENQHRLLMCCRMAKALGKGEVTLNASVPKMCWALEKDDKVSNVFYSISELENYLEHLLENRYRLGVKSVARMESSVKRRMGVIRERYRSRTKGGAMVFPSRINT